MPEENDYSSFEAPQDWSDSDKEMFNRTSDDNKEFLLRRHGDMEKGYYEKSQKLKKEQDYAGQVYDILENYRNDFATNGLDDIGAIRSVFSIYEGLKNDPQGTLEMLGKQFGYNQSSNDSDNDDYSNYVDPAIQSEIDELKRQLNTTNAVLSQQQKSHVNDKLSLYESETDSTGNLKFPFFSDAKTKTLQIYESGAAKDLDEAYQMAVAANPELREKQSKLYQSSEQKRKANEADKAKKASQGVHSRGGSFEKNENENKSLHDLIANIYDKQVSGG